MISHQQLDNTQFNRLVREVAYAPGPVPKQRAIAHVMGALVSADVLGVWARKLCRNPALREDAQSVLSEKILRSLNQITPTDFERVGDWLRHFWGQSERVIRDYLSSSEVTPASGMGGVVRRSWTLQRATSQLSVQLGRTPTPDEVMAHANAQTRLRDKDPQKHGTLLTGEDFTGAGRTVADLDESENTLTEQRFDAGYMETRVEASLAFKHVLDECRRLHPGNVELLEVARVWANLLLRDESVSTLQVANLTGFSRERTRGLLAQLEIVLGEVRAQSETVSK